MVNNEAREFLYRHNQELQSISLDACEAMTTVPDAKDLKRQIFVHFLIFERLKWGCHT